MSLNLHATVRGAIRTVNKDRPAFYYESAGYGSDASGRQVPKYLAPITVLIQAQPPAGRDLKHMEFLNIQGTTRVVWLYSNAHAISRVSAKGGDLLQFSGFVGAPVENWLVASVGERWDVGTNEAPFSELPASPPVSGWSKLYCVLQIDRPILSAQIVTDSGQPIGTQGGADIVTQGSGP